MSNEERRDIFFYWIEYGDEKCTVACLLFEAHRFITPAVIAEIDGLVRGYQQSTWSSGGNNSRFRKGNFNRASALSKTSWAKYKIKKINGCFTGFICMYATWKVFISVLYCQWGYMVKSPNWTRERTVEPKQWILPPPKESKAIHANLFHLHNAYILLWL